MLNMDTNSDDNIQLTRVQSPSSVAWQEVLEAMLSASNMVEDQNTHANNGPPDSVPRRSTTTSNSNMGGLEATTTAPHKRKQAISCTSGSTEFQIQQKVKRGGEGNTPAGRCDRPHPSIISDPIAVRIPSSALRLLPNRASSSGEGDCIVGLATRSYMPVGRRELLYVILLEDGNEVHLPCGAVEQIALDETVGYSDDIRNDNLLEGLHLPCHDSSIESESDSDFSSDAGYDNIFLDNSFGSSSQLFDISDNLHAIPNTESVLCSSSFIGCPTLHTLCIDDMITADILRDQSPSPTIPPLLTMESATFEPFDGNLNIVVDKIQSSSEDQLPAFTDFFKQMLFEDSLTTTALNPACLGAEEKQTLVLMCPQLPQQALTLEQINTPQPPSCTTTPQAVFIGIKRAARGSQPPVTTSGKDCRLPFSTRHASERTPPDCRTSKQVGEMMTQTDLPPHDAGSGRHVRRSTVDGDLQKGNAKRFSSRLQEDSSANVVGTSPGHPPSPERGQRRGAQNVEGSATPATRRHRNSQAVELAAFRHSFREETWSTEYMTYIHDPVRFTGPTSGPAFPHHRLPSKLSLFTRFWSEKILERICHETNRYASEVNPETHLPVGGPYWWGLSPIELWAFLGISMMMDIKRLPNHRAYWNKQFSFLYSHDVASTMSKSRFEDITRCLHVADDTVLEDAGDYNHGSQLSKLGWLMEQITQSCKSNWNLHQQVTVDESMIRYKGKYCPIRQYLPKKPTKWGIKVWALADAVKKYVYDFQVYTGSVRRDYQRGCRGGGAKSGYDVVMLLMSGLHGRGHVVVTDNYFTSVKLLVDLAKLGTYGDGTVVGNRVGLPKALSVKQNFSDEPQGTIAWRMHGSRTVSCVVWVDCRPVLLLSSFFTPLPRFGEKWPTVPCWVYGEELKIVTSPVHKGYTEFLRGVDVADQMRGAYSSQVRSQKWWHRIFFFLLDTSVVNCYILYKTICERLLQEPMQ